MPTVSRILLCILLASGAGAQEIRPSQLRILFGIPVEKLSAEGDLKAMWPLEKKEELRAFRKSEGLALQNGGGISLGDGSELAWQELAFERGTFSFEVWLEAAEVEVRVACVNPGPAGDGSVSFFNSTIGEGKERRAGAAIVVPDGLEAPEATIPCALEPGRWHALRITAGDGKTSLAAGDRTLESPATPPHDLFTFAVSPAGGGIRVRRLAVDGRVHLPALRKLMAAGKATKTGERARPELRRTGGEALNQLLEEERRLVMDALLKVKEREESPGAPGDPSVLESRNRSVERLNETLKLWSEDQFPEALGKLSHVDQEWFEGGTVACLRGFIEHDAGRDGEALASFDAAARQRKKFPEPLRAAAVIHIVNRDLKAAEASLTKARALAPDDPWTIAFQGMIQLQGGNLGGARTLLEVAAEKLRSAEGAKLLLGHVKRLSTRPAWATTAKKSTKWYEIESGVPGVVDGTASDLERFRAFLERDFPITAKQRKAARVWIFDAEEEYLAFTDTLMELAEHSLGCYVPPIGTFLFFASLDEELNREVLFHEAFHHYLALAALNAPPWFDEGLAEHYGSTTFDDQGTPVTGDALGIRHSALAAALEQGKVQDFEVLMNLDHKSFMAEDRAEFHYAQSRALVHWFRRGPEPKAAPLFRAYTAAVLAGKSPGDAFKAAFGGVPAEELHRLQAAFLAHAKALVAGGSGGG